MNIIAILSFSVGILTLCYALLTNQKNATKNVSYTLFGISLLIPILNTSITLLNEYQNKRKSNDEKHFKMEISNKVDVVIQKLDTVHSFKNIAVNSEQLLTKEINEALFEKHYKAVSLYEIGLDKYDKGQYNDAIEIFTRCIDIVNIPQFYIKRAASYYRDNKGEKSISDYNVAIAKYSTNDNKKQLAMATLKRGFVFDLLGNNEKFINDLHSSVNIFSSLGEDDLKDPIVWHNKGIALIYLNKKHQALKAIDISIKLDPNNKWSWNNKSSILNSLHKYNDAHESIDRALDLDPLNPKLIIAKSEIYLNQNKPNFAIDMYNEYLKIHPKDSDILNELGLIYSRENNYKNAVVKFSTASSIVNNTDPIILYNKAYSLECLKKHDEALKTINSAIKIDQNNADYIQLKSNILNNLSHFHEALSTVDEAISMLGRHDASLFLDKAIILTNLDKEREAIDAIQKLPLNKSRDINQLSTATFMFEKFGNLKEALHMINKAIAIEPDNLNLIIRKITILAKLNDEVEFRKAQNRGRELQKQFGSDESIIVPIISKETKFKITSS